MCRFLVWFKSSSQSDGDFTCKKKLCILLHYLQKYLSIWCVCIAGRKLADLCSGCPQDIEFSVLDGQIYLLQARPITTLLRYKRVQGCNASCVSQLQVYL